ncbi:hypothetical protein PHAVU_011G086200 [Phaseolus vulgaris]|uniref:BHLH domain-containing protein n=1 Tax=Phaseolus vulgaris TaxID=3885 RepID=V7AJQ9_PHAVU|nr:hypothetical protein PHAVU_011G086200g [Phaseolus vulgaris]ESW04331.1 hypothetical protein PHAVU_011G086200g [Phaseolus vulgaris]
MDTIHLHEETLLHIDDFELHDFVEDPNLDQLIDLIRSEKKHAICDFNSELMNEAFIDNSFLAPPAIPSDHCNSNAVNVYDSNSTPNSFAYFDGKAKGGGGGEEEDDMEHSSATTHSKSLVPKSKPKTDRSKTLISERRRRDRMKEKLHALRSLVPFITKMDKASIIGDAVSYMHELQAQANMLKDEVEGLETSLLVSKSYEGSNENLKNVEFNSLSICKKIIQMYMFQVDAKGFYVKIVCNKGEGVAASLYKSIESLRGFHVQNSNLSTVGNTFQLTFSLNVKSSEPEMNLHNLKIWVSEAFVKQGFEFYHF